MAKRSHCSQVRARSREAGMTLIETMIALAILFIASAGLTGLAAVALITTENQGHLAARVAEYSQDKMEQLMSLKYADSASDTISLNCLQFLVTAVCETGGSGLTPGGTSDSDCGEAGHPACVINYVDYLDADGNPRGGGLVPPAGWFYKRVWLISTPVGSTNLKQITVACKTRFVVGSANTGRVPRATLALFKSSPF